MTRIRTWIAIATVCFAATSSFAQPSKMPRESVIDVPMTCEGFCVHNVFQSNMVIQRGKPFRIWGWADSGENITASFLGKSQTTTAANDRSWSLTFPSMKANADPFEITVKGNEKTIQLTNVLVGDVWVLGGQSNMEFPLDRIENGNLEIVSANYDKIRILTVPALEGPDIKRNFPRLHEWSDWFNRHYRKGDWDVCRPEIARELSAIGYVFARRIHMATQVPIGVIDASRGGTTVETWTPDATLREMESVHVKAWLDDWDQRVAEFDSKKDLENRVKQHESWVARMKKDGKPIPPNRTTPTDLRAGPAMDHNRPGTCYASMIAPIAGFAVKGAIFHQGYNNCFRGTEGAMMYRDIFPVMIASWREAFEDPQMPFGILSLCTEGTPQTRDNYCELMSNPGPYIREAQYQTFLDLYQQGDKNIGFTSTYDLRRRWYHPQLKIPAGERIARWALRAQYGFERDIRWKPPFIESMTIEGSEIRLTFDEEIGGVDDGGPMKGFAIAGEDRKFHPADMRHAEIGKDDRGQPKLDRKTLVLSSPMVPSPIHYRYAWGRSPWGNIQARHNVDIPLATQRSDNWPLEDVPLGMFENVPTGRLDGRQRQIIKKTLQQQDLDRKLKEANRLLSSQK